MKKSLLLIPTLSMVATTPAVSCGLSTNQTQNLPIQNTENGEEENTGDCTFVYVGKNISEDGQPMMCRCMDMGATCEAHLKVYERDELANETFVGKNGFTYTLPEHTAKCVVAPVNKNINWGPYVDEMGVNEYGVVCSATLTTASNRDTALNPAVGGEPFVKNGIAEETIAHTIVPCAKTAREGVQLLVDIIASEKGNAGDEAVFIGDKEECWYVELLNGHKAVGVKLPDDKMFVQGNENALHTLVDYETNDIIATPGYDTVPYKVTDAAGHIDIFKTYARPLVKDEGTGSSTDGAHRRTWRGLNLFGPQEFRDNAYDSVAEYNWMFKPVTKPGMGEVKKEGVKINLNDVIGIYRDEFKDILDNPSDDNYEYFHRDYLNRSLRTIACNSTGQTHILRVDSAAEQSMAAQAWISFSPAKYSPFVPINAAINSVTDQYAYCGPNDDYSPKSAYWACRLLNTLSMIGDDKEERTGEPKYPNFHSQQVIDCLNAYQTIWEQEYQQVTDYAKNMDDKGKRNAFLTNYCNSVQDEAFKLVNDLCYDIMLYFMRIDPRKAPTAAPLFYPLVDVKEYAQKYGYEYEKTNEGLDLRKRDKRFSIIMPSGMVGELGKIKLNNTLIDNGLEASYKDGVAYIDFFKATQIFGESVIAQVNMDLYLPKLNMLVWLIPTVIGAAALVTGGILAFYFCYWKKRHTKTNHKSK